MRLRDVALAAAPLALSVAACQVAVPLEGAPAEPLDGGADGPHGLAPLGPSPIDPCAPLSEFNKPRPGDTDGPQALDFVMSTMVLNASQRAEYPEADLCEPGFDLDRRATCYDGATKRSLDECPDQKDLTSCRFGPTCRTTDKVHACDGPSGVDNAAGGLFGQSVIGRIPGLDPLVLSPTRFLRSAQANLIFHIAGYNGGPVDPDVTVSLYLSTGFVASAARAATPAEIEVGIANMVPPPEWDGIALRDWVVAVDSVDVPGTYKSRFEASGYVNKGTLVATFKELPLPLATPMTVLEATVTAQLRPRVDGAWELRFGRIGGRVELAEGLRNIAGMKFILAGGRPTTVCESELLYESVRSTLCDYADLAPELGAPCSQLSVGASFTAVPARLGPIRGSVPPAAVCLRGTSCL